MTDRVSRKEVLAALRSIYDPSRDHETGVEYVAVADLLGADHSRVYHHLESLVDDGTVEQVRRCRSGVVERGFRPQTSNRN
ncbi:hypothetical protein [Haloarchaeobius amylolyticus]|uniref:hypothetical protein n=1 Tax=Haloarchaeobius amylolyticus TaxID=1198296 RepID=UPI002270DB83|nr:hypothetical protein [Haloarchaeobius amylolyticus]